jgi:beta-glucanase (GH16 family)
MGKHTVDSIENYHTYTIDWKRDAITFYIDGKEVRKYRKDDVLADSQYLDKSKRFYPDRPQKVAFALWNNPQNTWTGIDLLTQAVL